MNLDENNQLNNEGGNFGLPGGYFQKSAGSILNKIEWEEEHKPYPNLLKFRSKRPFSIPAGYFNTSEARLELLECETLLSMAREQAFDVPQGYFESAETAGLANVLTEQHDELAAFPTLSSATRQSGFSVDESYFAVNEKLLNTLLAQDHKPARIIDLFFSRSSYVAAALLCIGLGLWLYSIYVRPVKDMQDCGTMACVDKADLLKTRNLENLDNDELYELVKPGELEKKLEKQSPPNATIKKDSSLKGLSTEELMEEI